jgi:hypothetical protein
MQKKSNRMQGSENAALSKSGRNKTYDSTNAVYFSLSLKNANVDSLETLIHEGISEFKIKTNNPELNALQKRSLQ